MRTEILAPSAPGDPVIDRVKARYGLTGEAFNRLEGTGAAAATWISAEWVLQRRPVSQRGRIAIARRLATAQPDHPALAGCRYHALTLLEPPEAGSEADAFWTLQERIPGHCPSDAKVHTGPTMLELAARMAPEAVRQVLELSRIPLPREAFMTEPTRGTALAGAAPEVVLAHARGVSPRAGALLAHRLDSEPRSEVVLTHGEPILRNQVLREDDAPLIDWATIGPLPLHVDLAHIASYLCRCLPPEGWEEASDLVGESAAPALGWDARTWRRAVVWQLVRDLVVYPVPERTFMALARLAARR